MDIRQYHTIATTVAGHGPVLHRFVVLVCLTLTITMSGSSLAQDNGIAVNFTPVSGQLHTAGQPAPEVLERLGEMGYGMVVNLATPASEGSIPTEGRLVTQGGATYVNIPVDWRNPTLADFELFSGVLDSAGDRKVLVHCQVNMRASMFTFLYRVVHQHVDPTEAYRAVSPIWNPRDQWLAFGKLVLQQHGIAFSFPE